MLEPGTSFDPTRDHIVLISDAGPGTGLLTGKPAFVNGSLAPARMEWIAGETHRVRVIQIAGDAEHVVMIKGPDGPVTWRPVAKDGADLPTAQAKPQPAVVSMGPGMTFDYEFTPSAAGELTLEVATLGIVNDRVAPDGRTIVPIRVRER